MFDVGMIEDFVEYLTLQVHLEHLEYTTSPSDLHAKLLAKMHPYILRYRDGLLAVNKLDPEGLSEAEFRRAVDIYQREMARIRGEQLAQLEAVRPLFEEALRCAEEPADVDPPERTISAAAVLAEEDSIHPQQGGSGRDTGMQG